MSIQVVSTWIASFDISMRGFDHSFFLFRYFDTSSSLEIRPKVFDPIRVTRKRKRSSCYECNIYVDIRTDIYCRCVIYVSLIV